MIKRKIANRLFNNLLAIVFCGATRNRTGDTRIFSPLLTSASKSLLTLTFGSNQLSYGTL